MVSFGELLGVVKTVTLDEGKLMSGKPSSVASSERVSNKVEPIELENAYRFDPIVFNSINKSVQTIMGAGYTIHAEDKEVQKHFIKLLGGIGDVGEETTFTELLTITFQNQMIYGHHFIELVYNDAMTALVDLVSLDPKQMDYARTAEDQIVLDELGKPKGYTQTLPYGVDTEGKGDAPPEEVALKPQQIFLLPIRIVHFKLYTYGNRFEAIGLIEPAYKSIIRRQNIEEAQANSIYARGTYPIIDYIGDENHYPTPNMIDKATLKLKQLQHNRYFAFPYWHNVKPLEVRQSEVVDNTMKYLRENASASLGLPIALATGSGESTNRATLANQQKFLEFSLRDIVRRTTATFRKQIFKKVSKLEDFEEVPILIWGEIDIEDKDDKAKRLVAYAHNKVGILLPNDVRKYAIKSEKLDIFDNLFEELSKYKKPIKKKLGKKEFTFKDVEELAKELKNEK